MDGREADEMHPVMSEGKTVKIAAVTASVLRQERACILASGVDDLIEKPFRSVAVFECIARHLGVQYVYERIQPLKSCRSSALSAEAMRVLPELLRRELMDALSASIGENAEAIHRASEVRFRSGCGPDPLPSVLRSQESLRRCRMGNGEQRTR